MTKNNSPYSILEEMERDYSWKNSNSDVLGYYDFNSFNNENLPVLGNWEEENFN